MIPEEEPAASPPAPEDLEDRTFRSSLDDSEQPTWFLPAASNNPRPLLIHLHSWSMDYRRAGAGYALVEECRKRDWHFLSPDFRGPNQRPEACASPQARQDILDALEAAQTWGTVDSRRIYLIGGSGGGHMGLVMCAQAPRAFAAASIWNPITDLAAWHAFSTTQDNPYAQMLEASCGGAPGETAEVDEEYHRRSPLPFLSAAAGLPIQLNGGIHDGHRGSVPVNHTLRAFNVLARANGNPEQEISPEAIDYIRERETIPDNLETHPRPQLLRQKPVLFYRRAGPVELNIFEGAHDSDFPDGVKWLENLAEESGP